MPAKPLFFFLLGWLAMCGFAGVSVAGARGFFSGAGVGLVLTVPMIIGAGIRRGANL